jgi:hypothetical protein
LTDCGLTDWRIADWRIDGLADCGLADCGLAINGSVIVDGDHRAHLSQSVNPQSTICESAIANL